MALTKPPVGTKVRFLGFTDGDEDSAKHIGEVGVVIETNPRYSERAQAAWLDTSFENWDNGEVILLEDDSEFEVVE